MLWEREELLLWSVGVFIIVCRRERVEIMLAVFCMKSTRGVYILDSKKLGAHTHAQLLSLSLCSWLLFLARKNLVQSIFSRVFLPVSISDSNELFHRPQENVVWGMEWREKTGESLVIGKIPVRPSNVIVYTDLQMCSCWCPTLDCCVYFTTAERKMDSHNEHATNKPVPAKEQQGQNIKSKFLQS